MKALASLQVLSERKSLEYNKKSLYELGAPFSNSSGTLIFTDSSHKVTICRNPLFSIEGRNKDLQIHIGSDIIQLSNEGLSPIQEIIDYISNLAPEARLYGGFAYEAFQLIEPVSIENATDYYDLPEILFSLFQEVHHIDPEKKSHSVLNCKIEFNGQAISPLRNSYGSQSHSTGEWTSLDKFPNSEVEMLLKESEYLNKINEVKNYIYEGEIYQANFTHLFRRKRVQDSWLQFCQLFAANPANYYVYWNLGDIQLCCTSPELFIKLQKDEITAHPIKGTSSKHENGLKQLLASSKDSAELSMIVDLFRNDLNRVCKAGSVKVTSHKETIELQNVYHMFSEVKGLCNNSTTAIDIIEAAFPSGSITGCPKIRSFDILQSLESCRRSFYTGSIGWISRDEIHLNVAIRTLFFLKEWVHFHVGGGIVYDSNPEDEFQETIDKSLPFFKIQDTD